MIPLVLMRQIYWYFFSFICNFALKLGSLLNAPAFRFNKMQLGCELLEVLIESLSDDKGKTPLKTVLIIDNDLGFVFWLGHVLDAAGYSALPAKSVPDAALLVMQLGFTVDVLAINPSLTGAGDFIAALHRSQKDVRVIGVLNDPQQVVHIPGLNAAHPKPTVFDEMAKAGWLKCIDAFCAVIHHAVS